MTIEKEPANGYTIEDEMMDTVKKYGIKLDDIVFQELRASVDRRVKNIKDGISMAISDYPEDISAVLPGIMEIINYNFDKKIEYGPKCAICGDKNRIDEFVSECWLQVPMDDGETGYVRWVCPYCVSKKANAN